jgi:type IV pilus assembly protein PilM
MSISFSRLAALLPTRTLVINCGATHVAGAEFKIDPNGRLHLARFARCAMDADSLARKPWAEVVGETLARLALQEQWRGRCLLALSGQHTLTKFLCTGVLEKKRRQAVLEFEAQQAIPCPLSEVIWDHALVTEDHGKMDFVVAAAKREVVEGLCEAVLAAGFVPERILPASTALLEAFRYGYPEMTERSLFVASGARSTQLVFIDDGRFFSRTFGFGGHTLDQIIADELDVSFTEAGQLKLAVLTGRPARADAVLAVGVNRAMARFEQRLQFELTRSIALYRERYGTEAPVTIFLSGEALRLPRLEETLGEKFACRVVRFEALRRIELSSGVTLDDRQSVPPELIGLAALAADREWNGPDLLPPSLRIETQRRQARPLMVTSAVLALAIIFPWSIYWHLRAHRAGENVGRMERQLVPIREQAVAIARDQAAIAVAKESIERLKLISEKRTAWIELMADLQERLAQVQYAWLDRLQLVSAESYQRAHELLKRLAQSRWVESVKDERFDNTQPGILRFSCTLVMNVAILL